VGCHTIEGADHAPLRSAVLGIIGTQDPNILKFSFFHHQGEIHTLNWVSIALGCNTLTA